MCRPLRGQARSHKGLWLALALPFTDDQNCGSGLAREGGSSANISIGFAGLFAGTPAHRDCGQPWGWRSLKIKTVGAGLLAKAVGQSTSLLDVPTSSRASPLPQGLWPAVGLAFTEDQNCGSGLARESGGSANISLGCSGPFAG